MGFNAKRIKDECVQWIKEWFDTHGKDCNAIIGISGGKDSTIVAALCCEAIGNDRVIGVLMPNGEQQDIDDAKKVCDLLSIRSYNINIKEIINTTNEAIRRAHKGFDRNFFDCSKQAHINLPPRIRMSVLYAVAQSHWGRVANTCNLSENWIGYSTRYGDSAGDFSPLSNLTVAEVKEIGRMLGLPKELIDKTPSDGLCGGTDEDVFGFTYDILDKYIRTGVCDDLKIKSKIDEMHENNLFKLSPMPEFNPEGVGYDV